MSTVAYELDEGRLHAAPGAAPPPADQWVPLWRWPDGGLVYQPAIAQPSPERFCRWALDCPDQAAVTIPHRTYGDIDACRKHADGYLHGTAFLGTLTDYEAEPECWCPDGKRPGTRKKVDYCPAHGRGPDRARSRPTVPVKVAADAGVHTGLVLTQPQARVVVAMLTLVCGDQEYFGDAFDGIEMATARRAAERLRAVYSLT